MQLREAKLENTKIKLDREREAKEREKEKRRSEIKKWKDGKKEAAVSGSSPQSSKPSTNAALGSTSEKELQTTITTLKQNLSIAARTAALYEMGCMGMSSLFPSPINGVAKGGAAKAKEVAPCLIRMCAGAETTERRLALVRAMNFITADKDTIRTGKVLDTTGFAKAVKGWMDDKDVVVR